MQEQQQLQGLGAHQTALIGTELLYVWAGWNYDFVQFEHHDSIEKRDFRSKMNIFKLSTGQWKTVRTSDEGDPPPYGVLGYTCTAINTKIYYFGGYCGHGFCFYNDLNEFDAETFKWKQLQAPSDDIPVMRRCFGGSVAIESESMRYLLFIGGMGISDNISPVPYKRIEGANYLNDGNSPTGSVRTNEHNMYNLSTEKWIDRVVISGNPIPGCNGFGIEGILPNKAVIFGGYIDNEGDIYVSDNLYIIEVVIINESEVEVHWQIIRKTVPWPVGRECCGFCIINGISPMLVVMGGNNEGETEPIDDHTCWLLNLKELDQPSWIQIEMPSTISERQYLRLTAFMMGTNRVWLVAVGGSVERYIRHNENFVVTFSGKLTPASDFTMITELAVKEDEGTWSFSFVKDSNNLGNEEYQSLFRSRQDENACLLQRGLQQSSPYVNIQIINSVLIGPPGVGKTAFKSFLFDWDPVIVHHSTPISAVPVRAITASKVAEDNGKWLDIDKHSKELFRILADAIKYLAMHKKYIVDTEPSGRQEDMPSNAAAVDVRNAVIPTTGNLIRSKQNQAMSRETTDEQQATVPISMTTPYAVLDPSEVQDILDLLPKVEGAGELLESKWVYLLDTGGQPQFADVSRAFVRTNSVYFILNKLTEKLSDKPNFCYSENGEPLVTPSKLRMTNLQLIKHFICSILSSKYEKDVDSSLVVQQPFVNVIGTHHDKYLELLSNLPPVEFENIEDKNDILLKEFKKCLNHFTFHSQFPEIHLIHTVNNICTGPERSDRSKSLRKKLLEAIEGKLKPRKVKIPVHQYLFDVLIKNKIGESGKESHGVVTLNECSDIGSKLGINIKDTLMFFDSLNLYLYFGDFQPLQHIVFTNPQYLLSLLSKLIQFSFVDQHSSNSTYAPCILSDTGIFDESLLDTFQFVPPHFTKKNFLQLLEYTRIIACVSTDPPPAQYFLLVALPLDEIPVIEKEEFIAMCECDPLFIKFNCNIVPQGVFLVVVVNLLNRQHPPTFSINNDEDTRTISKQLRYAIEFSSKELTGSLLLVEEFGWIEIHFNGEIGDCYKLLNAIKEAIEPCAELLGYKHSALQYDLLFPCGLPQHKKKGKHLVANINCDKRQANCNKAYPLTEKQFCWFTNNCTESMSSELSEVRPTCSTSKVINSPQVSLQYKKRQEQELLPVNVSVNQQYTIESNDVSLTQTCTEETSSISILQTIDTCATLVSTGASPILTTKDQQPLDDELVKKVFRKHFAELTNLLSISNNRLTVAAELYSAELISRACYAQATDDSPRSDQAKGISLANALAATIDSQPQLITKVITIFASINLETFNSLVNKFFLNYFCPQ